jgi:hypothetical protein
MPELSLEDIAALRKQGDFAEYLRSLVGGPPPPEPAKAKPEPISFGPGHRPGAWPAGTRPAGPNTCDPDCECALNHPPGSAP